jgi:NAD-dependent SIR2 family protein deacetylase/tetratricopeptide (TPR) repeat protein
MDEAPSTDDIYPTDEFVADFATWVENQHDLRYCFVIGAGASRSSGIPTGAALVDGWLEARHPRRADGTSDAPIERWAEDRFRSWEGFSWEARAAFYGRLYQWFYRDNATGQAALRQIMARKSPSFGYSVLATLLENTRHRVVLTTNFDNLVRDALSAHCPEANPFVCHGERDARFLAGHGDRIRIVKIHGDIDRETYNAAAQIESLHAEWTVALRGILTDHTPIFLGYGGNDPGFMRFLIELPEAQFRARPIWAYYLDPRTGHPGSTTHAAALPTSPLVRQFMARHRGLWLPTPGFDELMLLLGHALGYGNRATRIRAEADRRALDYERTLGEAVRASRGLSDHFPGLKELVAVAEAALLGTARDRRWEEWRIALDAEISTDRKRKLYETALEELPRSAELKASYAAFLAESDPRDPAIDVQLGRARRIVKDRRGAESAARAEVLYQTAFIQHLRQERDARRSAKKAYGEADRLFGAEHPSTLRAMSLLAVVSQARRQYKTSLRLHTAVLDGRTKALGPEHPSTLWSQSNVASVLFELGRYEEAEPLAKAVLDVRTRVLGEDHRDTLMSMGNLGLTRWKRGSPDAGPLLRKAAEGLARVLGPNHAYARQAAADLAVFEEAQRVA